MLGHIVLVIVIATFSIISYTRCYQHWARHLGTAEGRVEDSRTMLHLGDRGPRLTQLCYKHCYGCLHDAACTSNGAQPSTPFLTLTLFLTKTPFSPNR